MYVPVLPTPALFYRKKGKTSSIVKNADKDNGKSKGSDKRQGDNIHGALWLLFDSGYRISSNERPGRLSKISDFIQVAYRKIEIICQTFFAYTI